MYARPDIRPLLKTSVGARTTRRDIKNCMESMQNRHLKKISFFIQYTGVIILKMQNGENNKFLLLHISWMTNRDELIVYLLVLGAICWSSPHRTE